MLGPKINTVFKSRWNALFWSAGILLTAYCSVPSAEETKSKQAKQEHSQEQKDPWAKTEKLVQSLPSRKDLK